jgi:2,3-dihydroxybenzoate-AMP ligase
VPFGEVGEMCARGPYTLRGYYGAPEHNAKAFTPDGFYCSGDLMRQHPSGNYMVEGRKKDLINRGGEKISAEEIENLILQHDAVQNVACIAVPDPDMGERMCACVILRPGQNLKLDSLVAFLHGKEIAKFKLPERLEIVGDFPLSTFGKVSKKSLVEMVSQKIAAK